MLEPAADPNAMGRHASRAAAQQREECRRPCAQLSWMSAAALRRGAHEKYKYRFKLLYEISVFMRPVKVRKTKSLKLSSAAARP
jgi:hypothetical protein